MGVEELRSESWDASLGLWVMVKNDIYLEQDGRYWLAVKWFNFFFFLTGVLFKFFPLPTAFIQVVINSLGLRLIIILFEGMYFQVMIDKRCVLKYAYI